MALTFSGVNGAATTSVTIPAHSVGDIIVILAGDQAGATAITKPAASGTVPAWVDIDSVSAVQSMALRTAYYVATATNTTSGTWTNCNAILAVVLSGQSATPIGGHGTGNGAGSTSSVAPAVTLTATDGTSALLHFFLSRANTTVWSAAPAGYTARYSTTGSVALDTKDVTTSDGACTQAHSNTGATLGVYIGATVEILAAATAVTVTPTGASLTVTGGTPVVSTPRLATPSGASLAVTGGTPVLVAPVTQVPSGDWLRLAVAHSRYPVGRRLFPPR
jgi:hypothetical protein